MNGETILLIILTPILFILSLLIPFYLMQKSTTWLEHFLPEVSPERLKKFSETAVIILFFIITFAVVIFT